MTDRLTVSGVTKSYRSGTVLQDVTFAADDGEIVAIVGPNGAGKTSLFRILAGLSRPTSGSVKISAPDSGHALNGVTALIDGPGCYPHLSGRDNLRVLAWAGGVRPSRARLDEVLHSVGLEANKRAVATYSMGMRQRLAIASILLTNCPIVILDEPTSGMDTVGIHDMRAMIKGLAALHRTVLWSSHDLREVEDLATTLLLINHGEVVFRGTPAELPNTGEIIELQVPDPSKAQDVLRRRGVITTISPTAVSCTGTEMQDLLMALTDAGIVPSNITVTRSNLEQLFFSLAAGRTRGATTSEG